MRNASSALLALLVPALFLACDAEPTTPKPSASSVLRVVSGAGVADTVDAILPELLVVELTTSRGKPIPGAQVHFSGTGGGNGPRVLAAKPGTEAYSADLVDTTDATGRVSLRVRLGSRAAPVTMAIQVIDELTLRTTATYTVEPGFAVRLRAAPRDTLLYAGKQYLLGVVARDRHDNATSRGVGFTSLTPNSVRVNGQGAVETLDVGRGRVLVSAGPASDTAFVSIPPAGAITAVQSAGSGSPYRIRVSSMNLDGSGRTIEVESGLWSDAGVSWSPDRSTLAVALGDHDTNLFRKTASGSTALITTPTELWSKSFPRYSPDGAWIYFNGRVGGSPTAIWRVRADGTGAERIGPPAGEYDVDAGPDPSPDGTRVVYSTNRVNATMPVLRILTLATRSVQPIDVPGVTPRWSPDGRRIAYIPTGPSWGYLSDSRAMMSAGQLMLMNPDGTNRVAINTGAKRWRPHFDFSPDGRFILAVSESNVLELIEVATGETIPLHHAAGFYLPVWKN